MFTAIRLLCHAAAMLTVAFIVGLPSRLLFDGRFAREVMEDAKSSAADLFA